MGKWWQADKEDKDDKAKNGEGSEFELKPEELKKQLAKVDALDTKISGMDEKLKSLDTITDYIKSQKEAEARRLAEAKAKEGKDKKEQTDIDLNDEFLTDPANVTRKIMQETISPLIESQINTAARITMNDLFSTQPDTYEYITDPTIRKEVEAHVATLPLKDRNNPEAIKNCYYVATGRHQAEIKEGKIKSRLSAAGSAGSGTGGPESKTEQSITLSEAEKKAARIFGLKEEDYAKSKKELSYV